MGHKENLVRERLEREAVVEERRLQERERERERVRAEEEREKERLITTIAAEIDRIGKLLTDEDWATRGNIYKVPAKSPDSDRARSRKFAWLKSRTKRPATTEYEEIAILSIFTGSTTGFLGSGGQHYAQDEYLFGTIAEVLEDRNVSYLTVAADALARVSTSSELPVLVKKA